MYKKYGQTDNNTQLAKENASLKASIAEGVLEREGLMRACVKAEHFSRVVYKSALAAINTSINHLQTCLADCKAARARMAEQYRIVKNKTGRDEVIKSMKVGGREVLKDKNWNFKGGAGDGDEAAVSKAVVPTALFTSPSTSVNKNTQNCAFIDKAIKNQSAIENQTIFIKRNKPNVRTARTERLKTLRVFKYKAKK